MLSRVNDGNANHQRPTETQLLAHMESATNNLEVEGNRGQLPGRPKPRDCLILRPLCEGHKRNLEVMYNNVCSVVVIGLLVVSSYLFPLLIS